VVEEYDRTAGPAKLLQDQCLIGVFAGEAIGAEHSDDVDLGIADAVAQGIEPGPVEPGAAVPLVAEDMLGHELMAGFLRPGTQGGELAVDGLLAFLALGRDAGIDGGAHGSSLSL
jgi:hypothetical protein